MKKTFFLRLMRCSETGDPLGFLGTAFPIGPDGSLLTCRHCVDLRLQQGEIVCAVNDSVETPLRARLETVQLANNMDLALLPEVLGNHSGPYFPIIEPKRILVVEDVHTFGFFSVGKAVTGIQEGYFKGNVVNFIDVSPGLIPKMTLSFPVIEGLSGSPLLIYHNGTKLAGVNTGNVQARILAHEVWEHEEERTVSRETIHRVVEFGVAYHPAAVVAFLDLIKYRKYRVSSQREDIEGI